MFLNWLNFFSDTIDFWFILILKFVCITLGLMCVLFFHSRYNVLILVTVLNVTNQYEFTKNYDFIKKYCQLTTNRLEARENG